METVGNISRPNDAYNTIRVLVEQGQCGPMVKTVPKGRYVRETAIEYYSGPREGLQYFLQQDHFIIGFTNNQ